MSQNESDVRLISEQIKKLPEEVQDRVGYIIQGALLVAGNYAASEKQAEADQPSA